LDKNIDTDNRKAELTTLLRTKAIPTRPRRSPALSSPKPAQQRRLQRELVPM